ncbi:MAG TPA: HEAT repeat domain-containing protein [Planctomycetota bacterium]
MSRPCETRRGPGRHRSGLFLGLAGLALLGCARDEEAWRRELAAPDPFVRGLAAIGLALQAPRQAGPALPELLETIDRPDLGLERAATRALAEAGRFHLPVLLERLVGDETLTLQRRRALQEALVAAGPEAAPPVVACLRGPGRRQVGTLGEVLLALGEPAVAPLVELLAAEPDVRLKSYAAFLLAGIGPRARAALPALRVAAEASDPDLRRMASEAIASLEGRPWQVPAVGGAAR